MGAFTQGAAAQNEVLKGPQLGSKFPKEPHTIYIPHILLRRFCSSQECRDMGSMKELTRPTILPLDPVIAL